MSMYFIRKTRHQWKLCAQFAGIHRVNRKANVFDKRLKLCCI